MRKLPRSSKLLIQVNRFFWRYFQPSCHTAQAEQKQFQVPFCNLQSKICVRSVWFKIQDFKTYFTFLNLDTQYLQDSTSQIRHCQTLWKKENWKSNLAEAVAFALTTDGWTSRPTESYVTITCNYIDKEWKLRSNVLQVWPFYLTEC